MQMPPPSLFPLRAERAALAIIAVMLTGCVTASVESRPLAPEELTAPVMDQRLEGVIYFPPRPYLLVYQFTQSDGAAPRSPVRPGAPASDSVRCTRVIQKTELQVLPDFAHPRLMVPKRHGIGTARLSVTLSNGMISAVNADGAGTLSDALKALAGGYADVLNATKGVATGPVAEGSRACNVGPVLTAIVPVDWSGSPIRPLADSVPAARSP